jgi:ubiquinone/menaquinone biosynthesis C-methylase UbiE
MEKAKSKLKNIETVASQLKKPQGAVGREVGMMMNKGNKLMNLAAIEKLKVTANDNILEIGMGNGFFVKEIVSKDKTVRYTGCDFSKMMVLEATSINAEYIQTGQAQFTQANVNRLPYKKESFNKVFTVNTIYFWEDAKKVLAEIRRILKNDGILIIALRPKSIMADLPVVKYGFNTFSREDCIKLLVENGFKMMSVSEKEEQDIELFGAKYKNAFMVVKAVKK